MVIFLDAKRGVRATVVIGGAAPIRAGRDVCLDTDAIVANVKKLYANTLELFSMALPIFLKSGFLLFNFCGKLIEKNQFYIGEGSSKKKDTIQIVTVMRGFRVWVLFSCIVILAARMFVGKRSSRASVSFMLE
jgi:hypothetical protein